MLSLVRSRRAVVATMIGSIGMNTGPVAAATPVERLIVSRGHLICRELALRCAIGRGGLRRDKAEGDGATPIGRFPLRQVFFRADRVPAVATGLPVRALARDDGWCDDARDPRYNTPIKLPDPARAETLWRDDHLYDVIVVIGYNDAPVVAGKGSAIFLHVARPDFGLTDGCVAIALAGLLEVARRCGPATVMDVQGG